MKNRIKVMTILGTRPELIRLSQVIKSLSNHTDHVLVHTGQNYDHELNGIFFDELGLDPPDYCLDVNTSTLGHVIGEIIIKTEEVLVIEKPDAVLVLGDTNSGLALLIARRMKIPTYHMEAGNRCFDSNVPEETNRRLLDHIADFNLVYTEHARRNLLDEGLPSRFIYLTGSPMREVLNTHLTSIDDSKVLDLHSLLRGEYFVVSVHREENVDCKTKLEKIVHCLVSLADEYKMPIIVTTHPRTAGRLQRWSLETGDRDIRFLKPFGFFDYLKLQVNAFCTLSDSGTISEESAIMDFPAVTLRESMERPEALDTGTIIISGLEPCSVSQAVRVATEQRMRSRVRETPAGYNVTDTSMRVTQLILGTAGLCGKWLNREDFNRHD